MRYLLAIFCPTLAVLLCGRPFLAVFHLLLMMTVVGWIPAAVHACLIVADHKTSRRHREQLAELRQTNTLLSRR